MAFPCFHGRIFASPRARWRIELFFKWIKQHLLLCEVARYVARVRFKAFYGTSQNAVKTQIWIAVSTHLLLAILKKELGLEQSLYTILQVLSVTLFEKIPVLQVLANNHGKTYEDDSSIQLKLFDL